MAEAMPDPSVSLEAMNSGSHTQDVPGHSQGFTMQVGEAEMAGCLPQNLIPSPSLCTEPRFLTRYSTLVHPPSYCYNTDVMAEALAASLGYEDKRHLLGIVKQTAGRGPGPDDITKLLCHWNAVHIWTLFK